MSSSSSGNEGLFTIWVRPRSARSGIERGSDGSIVVRTHAPPAEGAANRECEAIVAKALALPKSAVRIVGGRRSRAKRVAVSGLSPAEAMARLEAVAGGRPS